MMQWERRHGILFQACCITLVMCCQLSRSQESCDVLTRLPTSLVEFKDEESCTRPCEVWTSFNICQVDPTCFFKNTLYLVEPSIHGHVLDLANLLTPSDIEKRMKLVPVIAKNVLKQIDNVYDKITDIQFQFKERSPDPLETLPQDSLYEQPPQDLNVTPQSNHTCAQTCEFLYEGNCRLGALCYFNEEIEELQRRNYPLSYLLNLSALNSEVHKFDDQSVVDELFSKLRIAKIQLRTFLSYAYDTYNIMVDINNRNIERLTNHLKNSEFTEAKNIDAQCSDVYRSLIHRPEKLECSQKYLAFFHQPVLPVPSKASPALGGFAQGFAGPGSAGAFNVGPNCPGECMVWADNNCTLDIKCVKEKRKQSN